MPESPPRRPARNRVRTVGAVVCHRGRQAGSRRAERSCGRATAVAARGGADATAPGDLGWFWRFGAEATAAAVRTWSRDGRILAVGLLDGPELLRLMIAPDAQRDVEPAQQPVGDVTGPESGVLIEGRAYVEAPTGSRLPHPRARSDVRRRSADTSTDVLRGAAVRFDVPCQRANFSMAAGVTGVKKLTRLPSGSRNSSDRLPQGIVVGSLTKSVTKPVRFW